MVVEPVLHSLVLVRVQVHLDGLERLHVQHVVGVIERRLLVVERREAHALKVSAVTLLPPHHDPHRPVISGYYEHNALILENQRVNIC